MMNNVPKAFLFYQWIIKIYVMKYFDVTWERTYVLILVVDTNLRVRSEC